MIIDKNEPLTEEQQRNMLLAARHDLQNGPLCDALWQDRLLRPSDMMDMIYILSSRYDDKTAWETYCELDTVVRDKFMDAIREYKTAEQPKILVYVSGGLVQSVKCNIHGATVAVFDADADEWDEVAEREYSEISGKPEYKDIF